MKNRDFFFMLTPRFLEKTLKKWYNISIEMSDKND